MGNRLREGGYGVFFASVFLMCQSPANGLSLDDIRVLSQLGEPLVAEVVVTAAAGEVINRACFSTMASTGDLPGVGTVRLSLSRSLNINVLRIAGTQPMREPLSEFVLQVRCAGVPTMVKNFLVMVDPPGLNEAVTRPATIASPVMATTRNQQAQQTRQTRTQSRVRSAPGPAIEPGRQYTVRTGDMLSTIAARVSGRPDWSVWPIAQQIYASNPGAFLLGDPNVIAQGSVISIPRLADVDLSVSTASVRPTTGAARPPVVVATNPSFKPPVVVTPNPSFKPPVAVVPAAATPAATVARIMPTPTVAIPPATPLPSMQLTTRFFSESQIKVLLRAQGQPVMPAVVVSALENQVNSAPEPQSEPDRPDSAATSTRVALQPGQSTQTDTRLNWVWIVVGLLTGLLMGALSAVGLFRHNLRREYEHDLRDGVQRQVQSDRLRLQREQAMASTAGSNNIPVAAATMDLSPTVETDINTARTMEMPTVDNLDFELAGSDPAYDELAKLGEPETLEMPRAPSELDLELPAETGKTGQHEVDFDLLEAAYSADYQAEFVNPSEASDDDKTEDSVDNTKRYYHLENRDPTDETPLPIELGEDEMGTDDSTDGDNKIVRFRR